MKLKHFVLIAVLMALLVPCQSHGYELPVSADDGVFARTVGLVKAPVPTGHAEICLNLNEYSEGGICLYAGVLIEQVMHEFQRVQAEVRRAERLAALTRCARHVSEGYTDGRGAGGLVAAPSAVKAVVCAANEIDTMPYSWGGGHNSEFAPGGKEKNSGPGYDCSGAVSYALHGGDFLESPLDSTGLSTWGEPGPGRWITVYANPDHAWMTVAGLTFDTSGTGGSGPRWHPSPVNLAESYVVRHPSGY
jgi:hypothetical protein